MFGDNDAPALTQADVAMESSDVVLMKSDPLAAGVFYPFTLSPEIAALAMSGSSALVAVNALMLKRTRLAGIHRSAAHQAQQ